MICHSFCTSMITSRYTVLNDEFRKGEIDRLTKHKKDRQPGSG